MALLSNLGEGDNLGSTSSLLNCPQKAKTKWGAIKLIVESRQEIYSVWPYWEDRQGGPANASSLSQSPEVRSTFIK